MTRHNDNDARGTTRLEDYFTRLGATSDAAESLADHFGDAESFLEASFQERLEAVVGTRQASAVVDEFDDFEQFRDWASYAQIADLGGIGRTSADKIARAYVSSRMPPRDFLYAADLAEKMGLYDPDREQPSGDQAELGDWRVVTDGGTKA